MLLGQSAQGIYVLRRLRVAAWVTVVKALQASPNKGWLAVNRAERVAGRLARRGTAAPSPPAQAPG